MKWEGVLEEKKPKGLIDLYIEGDWKWDKEFEGISSDRVALYSRLLVYYSSVRLHLTSQCPLVQSYHSSHPAV